MTQSGSDRYRLTITVRKSDNASILDMSGPLGTGEPLRVFRDKIDELLSSGVKNFAINLIKVPYMDSSGIGALVGAHTSIEAAGGKCMYFAALPRVMQVLRTTGVDQVLNLFGDEVSALSNF